MPTIFAEIESPLVFTRFEAGKQVAGKPGFYPGVLVIEKGLAKGHFAVKDGNRVVNFDPNNAEHKKLQRFQIVIGDATLDDVVKCGVENEATKCKLDHGSTVFGIVGDYTGFHRSGDQVRAELSLDPDLDGYKHAVALVKRFAKKIGNSIDFDYSYEIEDDVAIARCRKLNSVDLVDTPAATKSLFTENPTQPPTHMPLDAADLKAIENLVDSKFTAHKSEISNQLSALSKRFEEGDDKDDADKKDKDEEKDKAEMSRIASTAALAAVEQCFPKAQREQFAKLATPEGKSKFEQLIDTQLAAGAPNRGVAIQRIARDHKDVYNAHMSAQNGGQSGTL